MNADKCHLLVTNHEEDVSITIDDEMIKGSKTGCNNQQWVHFNDHISNICNKVSRKLHALAHSSNLMSRDHLRLILKAFIESQFSYCPIIWMFHSRTMNSRINRLHERHLGYYTMTLI